MKLKKIKIKKRNKNYKNIRNKVEKMNRRQEPKKTTGTIIAIILISALVFLIVGTKVFGFLPSILFTIIYLLMMLLVRVIDRNPIGSRKRKRAKRTFLLLLLLGIIGVIAFIVFFIIIIISAPQFNAKNLQRNETTVLYNKDGKVITSLGNEKREKLKYDELPNVLVDAVVATEDSRFFQHNGLDAPRFAKAVMGQLAGHSDAGGGSTLTMQVSKNSFTSTEASGIKGIMRKFTDIYLSIFKIERKYTKQEIIEFYVNQPFLGSNSYGVEQAARTYFGKHANELNLAEASLIAGLFQAPTAYDPFVDIDAATKRRSVVLSLMVRHGYITEEEKEIAEQVKIEEPTTEEIEANTPTVEEEVTPVEEPEVEAVEEPVVEEPAIEQTTNSILPQPSNTTSTNDEIIALQNRVAEVEAKYDGLVNELQTIFATPVFAQLLSQAFAENQVTAEAN